jgi:hypothetical protein
LLSDLENAILLLRKAMKDKSPVRLACSISNASLSVDGFVEKIDRKFLQVRGKKSLVTLRLYRQRFSDRIHRGKRSRSGIRGARVHVLLALRPPER